MERKQGKPWSDGGWFVLLVDDNPLSLSLLVSLPSEEALEDEEEECDEDCSVSVSSTLEPEVEDELVLEVLVSLSSLSSPPSSEVDDVGWMSLSVSVASFDSAVLVSVLFELFDSSDTFWRSPVSLLSF